MTLLSPNVPAFRLTVDIVEDIIRFIKEKKIVSLYSEKACHIFHAISSEKLENVESLKNIQVIYIDCCSRKSWFIEGNLFSDIKDEVENVNEVALSSFLGNAIIMQNSIPNKKYVKIV